MKRTDPVVIICRAMLGLNVASFFVWPVLLVAGWECNYDSAVVGSLIFGWLATAMVVFVNTPLLWEYSKDN